MKRFGKYGRKASRIVKRGTSGEKAPLGRILCKFRLCMCTPHPREPPSGSRSLRMTLHNVISGQKAPLWQLLHNFLVAHVHTPSKGTPFRVTSLPVALSIMCNDTFCTIVVQNVPVAHAITSVIFHQGRFR